MNWKLWIYGLVAAFIGAGASAASNVIVLPLVLDAPTIQKIFTIAGYNALISGSIGGLLYLKTHPVPEWRGVERRLNPNQPIVVDAKDVKPEKSGDST